MRDINLIFIDASIIQRERERERDVAILSNKTNNAHETEEVRRANVAQHQKVSIFSAAEETVKNKKENKRLMI